MIDCGRRTWLAEQDLSPLPSPVRWSPLLAELGKHDWLNWTKHGWLNELLDRWRELA